MRYRWEKVALTGCQAGCALRWSLEFAADCNKEFTASWSPPLARKEPTVQLKERWDVGAAEPRSCCVQRSVTVCGNVPWFHLALLCEGVGLCRVSYEQSQKSPWGIGTSLHPPELTSEEPAAAWADLVNEAPVSASCASQHECSFAPALFPLCNAQSVGPQPPSLVTSGLSSPLCAALPLDRLCTSLLFPFQPGLRLFITGGW